MSEVLEVPPRFELGMEVLQTSQTEQGASGGRAILPHCATQNDRERLALNRSGAGVERLPDRIAKRVRVDGSGCWIWTGAKAKNGYGAVKWDGKTRSTHRTVYELLVGPVPPGLQIDHTCCVRACCNPAHLEAVTAAENSQRIDDRGRPRNTHIKPLFIGPRLHWSKVPIVPRTTPRSDDE